MKSKLNALLYRNIKLKMLKTLQNIKFNKSIILNNIKTNYVSINIKSKSTAARIVKKVALYSWLKKKLNNYTARRNINQFTYFSWNYMIIYILPKSTSLCFHSKTNKHHNFLDENHSQK